MTSAELKNKLINKGTNSLAKNDKEEHKLSSDIGRNCNSQVDFYQEENLSLQIIKLSKLVKLILGSRTILYWRPWL